MLCRIKTGITLVVPNLEWGIGTMLDAHECYPMRMSPDNQQGAYCTHKRILGWGQDLFLVAESETQRDVVPKVT